MRREKVSITLYKETIEYLDEVKASHRMPTRSSTIEKIVLDHREAMKETKDEEQ